MIGIYAHHHGSGHVQRALAVAAVLDDEVTILTSAAVAEHANPDPGRIRILPLPMDHDGPGAVAGPMPGPGDPAASPAGDPIAAEPTAGGHLHWVPLRQPGLRRRMAMIAEWIGRHQPAVMWTDISVEVTLGARLTGTPVVSTVLPGRRDDPPHTLAHSVCSALVAGWPRSAGAPVPAGASRPLIPVGGVSRFAGRRARTEGGASASEPGSGRGGPGPATGGRPRVLHLRGSGGDDRDTRWNAVRDELHDVEWVELGGPGGRWVSDPWDELCRADVVISAAGQSSIADLAAADARVVVVPEKRPFGEQDATAAHLRQLGVAVAGRHDTVDHLVRTVQQTLEQARAAPGAGSGLRAAWEVDGAAERLAAVLQSVAAGADPAVSDAGAGAGSGAAASAGASSGSGAGAVR